MTAPAEMPGNEDRLTAAWLGLNPYAPETWPLGTVKRLSRVRAEQGHQKFVEEVAKMMTPPPTTDGHWKARALAAEAALAAERERCAVIAETAADCLMDSTFTGVAAAIRAGE
jgi:hypothetical protein